MVTRYQLHVQNWQDCTRCKLQFNRSRVVISRGKVPCQLMFCGEAPGTSEDSIGIPFIGPAGKLLDQIIARAVPEEVTYLMTNLVGCIPVDPTGTGGKMDEPPDECIKACAPRVQDLVSICDPDLIICVGRLPHDWLMEKWHWQIKLHREIPMVDIMHPAAILRSNVAVKGLNIQRCEVTIRNSIMKYILKDKEV